MAIVGSLTMLAACSDSDTGWEDISASDDQPYQLLLKSYQPNEKETPFSLRAVSKDSQRSVSNFISAEQCRNVEVIQDERVIYIYYDTIGLTNFHSFRYSENLPTVFLCDNKNADCDGGLRERIGGETKPIKIC